MQLDNESASEARNVLLSAAGALALSAPASEGENGVSAEARSAPALDRRGTLLYGLGAVPFAIKDQGFQALLLLFYNQILGLPAILASTAIMLALLVDAFVDPLIGQWSDNRGSRGWGRRHPFLYAAALPVGLSYFLLWNPPQLDHAGLFAYLVVCSVAVRVSLSLYEIPSLALMPELTADYDRRTALLGWRALFGVLGALTFSVVTFQYLLVPDAAHPMGQLNPAGYRSYSAVAAIAMVVLIVLSALGTHHLIPTLQPSPRRSVTLRATLREAVEMIKNRSLLAMLLAGMFAGIGLGTSGGLNSYVATYFWGFSAANLSWLAMAAALGALLGLAGAPALVRRMGKKRACLLVFGLAIAAGVTPILLRLAGHGPANGTAELLWMLSGTGVLGTACGLATAVIAASMVADIVEDAELRTGRRAEGLLTSVNAFVAKSVSGLGVLLAGLVISLVDFPQRASPGAVVPEILTRLVLIYVAIVAVSLALSMWCLRWYSLSRESHAATLEALQQRRRARQG